MALVSWALAQVVVSKLLVLFVAQVVGSKLLVLFVAQA